MGRTTERSNGAAEEDSCPVPKIRATMSGDMYSRLGKRGTVKYPNMGSAVGQEENWLRICAAGNLGVG